MQATSEWFLPTVATFSPGSTSESHWLQPVLVLIVHWWPARVCVGGLLDTMKFSPWTTSQILYQSMDGCEVLKWLQCLHFRLRFPRISIYILWALVLTHGWYLQHFPYANFWLLVPNAPWKKVGPYLGVLWISWHGKWNKCFNFWGEKEFVKPFTKLYVLWIFYKNMYWSAWFDESVQDL